MTPPGHFCLCISETVRYTVMCFSDTVQDSEGYLLPYKVMSHLYRKCGRDGMKPEVGLHFRKSAKSCMPDCKSHDYKQQTLFHRLLSCFHGHLAWICCWHGFLMSIFIAICDPENVSCLWKFIDILLLSDYTISGFERDCDAIFVVWRRHVPHDVISPFIQFMDT